MQTPAGADCPHYYEDFNRGRNVRECRLVQANPASLPWQPKDCSDCPVPGILRANGSPNMALTLTLTRGLLGLGRRRVVQASCRRHLHPIAEPHVGCPECNAEQPGFSTLFGRTDND